MRFSAAQSIIGREFVVCRSKNQELNTLSSMGLCYHPMQSQSLEEGSEGMFMKDVAILNRFLLSVLFHIRKSCVCVCVCGGVCMAA